MIVGGYGAGMIDTDGELKRPRKIKLALLLPSLDTKRTGCLS